MPHQCVRCGTFYQDGSNEILKGCSCGSKLFFYVKKEKLEEMKKVTEKLTKTEKTQIEKDVFDIIGLQETYDEPVVLDLESIRIQKPGKYEIDLVSLFKDNPVIYKLAEGKYVIDLPETFNKLKTEKKSKKK
ncbi:MAG: Zn-ribbon containing protein [Candidatus Woesearchaeota archaeon]